MELLVKAGSKEFSASDTHLKKWRDGSIIDIRPDGTFKGKLERRRMAVITVPGDFWTFRGKAGWKNPNSAGFNLKKYASVIVNGKFPWEFGYVEGDDITRKNDWFMDFQELLNNGDITKSQYDSLYNYDQDHMSIVLPGAFTNYTRHEDIATRLNERKNMAISSGTYSIGSGLDYSTVAAFEADLTTLTGDLTGEHNDESTVVSSLVAFDIDTATYLLKLTAQSGEKHNGTFGNTTHAGGDGARITVDSFDRIQFSEASAGTMDNIELSDLVFDITGSGNEACRLNNGGDSGGELLMTRCVVKGDSDSFKGVRTNWTANNPVIRNNIFYDIGAIAGEGAVIISMDFGSPTHTVHNNTIIGCYTGINQTTSSITGTLNVDNNLLQASGAGGSFVDAGAGMTSGGHNITEDGLGPDGGYINKDVHTNSVFVNYAGDDFTLDSGGDSTNLAIVDDGTDLSATFTDDIIGQTRDTWYTGASEIVAAPAGVISDNMLLLGVG